MLSQIGSATSEQSMDTMEIYSQSVFPSDTLAVMKSLDEYPSSGGHWWAQTGYVIGVAPNGVTYSLPELYVETNGNTYSFQPIASTNWNTLHTFQVWISPTTGAANFAIDGNQVAVVGMPLNFNQGGRVNDFLEVHQSNGNYDLCSTSNYSFCGRWHNLQFYECGIVGQSCWNSWNCGGNCRVYAISTPPYYLVIGSVTDFSATYNADPPGGGCYKCFVATNL